MLPDILQLKKVQANATAFRADLLGIEVQVFATAITLS
jgi:hypothetical protein